MKVNFKVTDLLIKTKTLIYLNNTNPGFQSNLIG